MSVRIWSKNYPDRYSGGQLVGRLNSELLVPVCPLMMILIMSDMEQRISDELSECIRSHRDTVSHLHRMMESALIFETERDR